MYWWDERPNFGDAVGPWLVQAMSGHEPVNARRRKELSPVLWAVGSTIGYLDRNNVDIWGSGLMEPLQGSKLDALRKLENVRVHAVRGTETRSELVSKLGWEVPEVYGDPALLLPRFYTAKPAAQSGRIAVVPHYVHVKHLPSSLGDGSVVVDVASDLESVVDTIAQADVCISTSLHGIIIAQAYGVPWIWLRVVDHPLGGDAFKFRDFFSTIDDSQASTVAVKASELGTLDIESLASRATLPSLTIALDSLESAFPFARGEGFEAESDLPPLPTPLAQLSRRARRRASHVKSRLVPKREADLLQPELIKALSTVASELKQSNRNTQRLLAEVGKQNRTMEAIRLESTSGVMTAVREFVNERQLTMIETLEHLVESENSFSRFGDGEFRLMLRSDFNLRFQSNSRPLQSELLATFRDAGRDRFDVGFPQIFGDAHWSGVWSELWPELKSNVPETGAFLNSHVTRPTVFEQYGDRAVDLWREVWRDRDIVFVTGAGSRFAATPALFSSARSTRTVSSLPVGAYDDLDRLVEELSEVGEGALVLLALGPAGTVLARRLALIGIRALDIGHISDSYHNVFSGGPRPESRPIRS
ncbi:GT-D fold domain-containing glycosyltransferase [Paraoerskovia marina]|uniref:GT-D fold domain-containing glycosyltransferase n=1 Tax=Paraoerskovia marina TaxID=545619 RepID=UPI001560ED52|nr:GT-D fold domain-containing glycosyltransferase [Paraoerskovia marina]